MSGPGPDDPFGGMPMFRDLAKLFASSGPVNWEVAKQLGQWLAIEGQPEPNVDPLHRLRYEELVRVAEMHVADVTGLATSRAGLLKVRPVGHAEWALRTLEDYKPLLESMALSMGRAGTGAGEPGVHDPQDELIGGLTQMLSPMLLGMQAGSMVGHLARRALGQYDFPIPRPASDELAVVPANIDAFAEDWSLPLDDMRMWVLLSEIAVHAVFVRDEVRAAFESLIGSYVAGFEPDPGYLETRLADVDPSDPESLQRALGDPQSILGAMQTPAQRETLVRLESLTCALVGYVDWVLDTAGRKLISSFPALSEALRRRRVERGEGDRFAEQLFGLSLGQAQYDRGTAFVRGVVERAGEDGLTRLWRSERTLPTPAEVDAPGLWLARIDLPED